MFCSSCITDVTSSFASAGLGKLANLSPDYVEAVAAMSSIDAFKEPAAAVPFNADSSMGSAAPGAVSLKRLVCGAIA